MAQPVRIPDTKIECCCANTMVDRGDRAAKMAGMDVGGFNVSNACAYIWDNVLHTYYCMHVLFLIGERVRWLNAVHGS